jgi:hypothetical protein
MDVPKVFGNEQLLSWDFNSDMLIHHDDFRIFTAARKTARRIGQLLRFATKDAIQQKKHTSTTF